MSNEYLATGFPDVDGRDDTSSYTNCLALLDSLPYFRRYKQRSYDLLSLTAGLSLLEIGCGIGDDVFRMASRILPDGKVVGVDTSIRMIEIAVSRNPIQAGVEFAQADARHLPFKENSFARCRVDRTLQHIQEPQQAIREMVRILQPTGILLAYDNDWGTFSISGTDDQTTRIIEMLWADAFTNRWIGRYLNRYFLEAGLKNVWVEPSVSVVTDFELADRIYNIRQTVKRAVATDHIDPVTAEGWLSDVQTQSRSGGFLCTLTAITVTGTKPS
jgi:ubiquinone/menaquinone biosynthesis C-methylase UbiE